MTAADLPLELFGFFLLAVLFVLTPVSLVILARIGARGIDSSVVGTLFRSSVIAAVHAPGLLHSPAVPRRGIPEMIVPAPVLFTLFQAGGDSQLAQVAWEMPALIAFLVPALLAWVALSWLMLHLRGSNWSEDARSTRNIKRLSLLGPLLVVAAPAIPAVLYRCPSPYPPMWAGAATMGWSFFLLFLAGLPSAASPSWVLRAWLVACLALGGFSLFIGFAMGIAVG
jgi:hypothetical protein